MNQKTRVLIVDDDVAMAKYLAAHLSRRNFEVTIASSDQEALRIFRSLDPMLVLLDTSMSAAEAVILERLKQIKPTVSILVLSANKDPESIFRASKMGADDYVSKPVDPKELDVRITKVLDNQQLVAEVTQLREQADLEMPSLLEIERKASMQAAREAIERVMMAQTRWSWRQAAKILVSRPSNPGGRK